MMNSKSLATEGKIVVDKNGEDSLSFYLVLKHNERHYLINHRYNGVLWKFYKNGAYMREITTLKPKRMKATQRLIRFNAHLINVVGSYKKHELSA